MGQIGSISFELVTDSFMKNQLISHFRFRLPLCYYLILINTVALIKSEYYYFLKRSTKSAVLNSLRDVAIAEMFVGCRDGKHAHSARPNQKIL